MRAGTGISCWLALLTSTTSADAQQKSPYQCTARASITSVIPVPSAILPAPSPPTQPIAHQPIAIQPIQPVASPSIPTANSGPPKITVIVPYTPAQPLRPNNDNFLVRLVGHLIGPTEADWGIPDTLVPNTAVNGVTNNMIPSSAPISENATVSPAALPPPTDSCCCAYRPYVPISSYFSFLRFRAGHPLLSTRTRPAPPHLVKSYGPQPRALDNSFRNNPADARLTPAP